ncbi:flagellar basal body-associated protein FliL [Desulfarculus baarsii DSM 2075]|uniref:Flagellar protein FliL n=1 Tax=Desulfarculus baarsii (strain ATCC 33931 / DSM 2075 / LMG 7858 / VKM B-1802 / 2st14) TaxID=644282 RepID=E1QJE3_DESB2|nr:flagellar basal body-associated FliL family protein [Desulfarculus baarsii]ADK85686.1 flagellar basal body-associated protein FliL [Desulfarculus baarsii DSM 2075]
MAQQQTKSPPAAVEGLNEAFDESILAEIEQRLEGGDDQFDESIAVGDKVELDRVDLPLDGFLPEGPKLESGEIEIDLADSGHLAGSTPGPEEEPQPPSKLKRLLLAVGSLVLVVAIAGGTGFWFSRQEAQKLPDAESLPPWMVRQAMPSVEDELMLGLEPFIVPLLDTKQGQILRVVVTLESMDGLSKSSLIEKNLDVRDVIYRALRDRPASELQKANQNRLLQAQIKAELNHALGREWVHKVYFSQFLISG